MLRICLILAIVAGLAAAGITWFKVQDIIVTTRQDRDSFHKQFTDETAAHNKTKKELATTKKDLDATKKDLAQTKSDLDSANSKVDDLTKHNGDLTAKLNKTTDERDAAQQKLAQWSQLPPPEEIKSIIADLAKTQKARDAMVAENKVLLKNYNNVKSKYDELVGGDNTVVLPDGLRGTILAVDPKYDFVVLNIGEDQGAKTRGEMMVDHDGKLLGKVRITSVSKDRCVANILPEWRRGPIMEGDEVLY